MADDGLSRMSLTEISGAIAKHEVSSKEVVQNTLELLEQHGTSLNCVARLFPEDALTEAELADHELSSGTIIYIYFGDFKNYVFGTTIYIYIYASPPL